MFGWPGCCCGSIIRVTVTGCNGLPVAGATATATLSGTDYTATTDASGVADIAVPGDGSYAVTSTLAPRFNASTSGPGGIQANPIAHSGALTDVARAMTPATGYHCINWESGGGGTGDRKCAYPLPDTLYLTDSVFGAVTLTWSASPLLWGGSKTVSYAACGGCPATTTTVTYGISATNFRGEVLMQYFHSATRDGLDNACPYATIYPFGPPFRLNGAAPLDSGGLTCPPAFEALFTIDPDAPGHFAKAYLYCGVAATFTLTE